MVGYCMLLPLPALKQATVRGAGAGLHAQRDVACAKSGRRQRGESGSEEDEDARLSESESARSRSGSPDARRAGVG